MLQPRAPLFSVGLAFGIGCLLGLDGLISLPWAFALLTAAALLWAFASRWPHLSLASFYALTACAGIAHTLLVGDLVPANDLRRLPAEKSLETTQWRGLIIEDPVSQETPGSRRVTERTSLLVKIEAWRPTGGRLFGAGMDLPWRPAEGEVSCLVLGPASQLQGGDRIEFAAALNPIPPPLVPGSLDFRDYQAQRGIYDEALITPSSWQRVESGRGSWWRDLPFRARDWTYSRLQIGLEDDPRTADFLAGMLIGYRKEIPADIEQDFRRTGTLHVFAVSGQNIAEMVLVAVVLLQLCGLVRWRWAWTMAPLVLLYCLLTGSPASAIRATVMALAILLAWRMERPLNALACWSLAFLAMLIWNPATLLDPGAQLSFAVVLGLILLASPIMRVLIRPFRHDPFLPAKLLTPAQRMEQRFWWFIAALLGSGIAATLMSEPITALDFHQVTPISILANLVVVPMAGLITIVGTLSVAVSIVSVPLTVLLNNANWLFARGLIAFVGFLAHEPGASVNVPDLRASSSQPPSFVIAPLQDSACLLVRSGGRAWLFNTGREPLARSATSHLLQYYGVNRLEGLALTAVSIPDNGGAAVIARDFPVQRLIVPALPTHSPVEKLLPDMTAATGLRLESWQRGQSIPLSPEVAVDVLHPAPDTPDVSANNRGLVLLFHAGGQTLLWAGKIDTATQEEIMAAYPGLRADVLVLGVNSPPSAAWLKSLGARYWLQIPVRSQLIPTSSGLALDNGPSHIWPLDQTGAVELRFQPAQDGRPPLILLQPWLSPGL